MLEEKDLKRHLFWYRIARLVSPLVLHKYTYKTDFLEKLPETSIVLSNHLTETDMFMAGSAFGDHLYFVCGEHLIRSKIGPFLQYCFHPIPAPRGGTKRQAVAEILRRVRRGHSILLFPEGCRSFNGETLPVPISTAKLIKKAGCGLVTYRIHGGYFIAPRWAYEFRTGHAEGTIVHFYSSEEMKNMSIEELVGHINEDLYENAYEYQAKAKLRYRGKRLAEGLENYLIICPECGSYDSMTSKGNAFQCTCCGTGGTYDEFGNLQGDNLKFHSVYDWGKWMETRFDEDIARTADSKLLFTEHDITLYRLTSDHRREDLAVGSLRIYRDRMEFDAPGMQKTVPFQEIMEASLLYYGKSYLFTIRDGYYGMTGPAFHAWKIDRLAGRKYPAQEGADAGSHQNLSGGSAELS